MPTLARLEADLTRLTQVMDIGDDAPALPIAQL